MVAYVVRKLLSVIPILFGVALLLFVLLNVVGGDPTLMMLGKHANAAQIAEVRHHYHYDDPLWLQFARYLGQIVTFDYGDSYATRQPIGQMILHGIGPSLVLAVPAFFGTTVIAVLIGLLAAYFRGKWIDRASIVACIFGMSVSVLAYILFGQYYLGYKWSLFPISGYEYGWPDCLQYIAMPAIIWIVVGLGYDVLFYRTAIIEETHQDYVRTARAKGLGESRIFLKHVLKNSMIPILTNVILEIPLLMLGSFLLEHFFSIPGIGNLTIDALNNSDFPVIRAMTTLGSFLFVLGNVATDILYTVFDPRVRLS